MYFLYKVPSISTYPVTQETAEKVKRTSLQIGRWLDSFLSMGKNIAAMDTFKKNERTSQPKRQSKALRIVSSIIVSFALLWWIKPYVRPSWSTHSTHAQPYITTDSEEFSWNNVRAME